MSIDSISVEPRTQYVSQLVLAVFEVNRMIFFQRLERNALPPLLGLIYTVNAKTQKKLEKVREKITGYIDTGNFSYLDVWQAYKAVLDILNRDILNDVVFGLVPSSAPTGSRAKPSARKYDSKMSDKLT